MQSPIVRSGKATLNRVARLFLSQPCPVCDRTTATAVCQDCHRQLLRAFQSDLLPRKAGATSVIALGSYDGALKRAILAMKYSDRPDVAYPLGIALAKRWQKVDARTINQKGLYVVPIPLHSKRQKSRGYNQAERIADAFCKASGLPIVPNGLERMKATQPQHLLNLEERQKNLHQVFQVSDAMKRKAQSVSKRAARTPKVLIIDDIYTTGATVQSAIDTFSQEGIAVVGVGVLAQTCSA